MYKNFLGDVVEVRLNDVKFRGTLKDVNSHYVVLLVVDANAASMEEVIINKKKINYISRRVTKKEKPSKY